MSFYATLAVLSLAWQSLSSVVFSSSYTLYLSTTIGEDDSDCGLTLEDACGSWDFTANLINEASSPDVGIHLDEGVFEASYGIERASGNLTCVGAGADASEISYNTLFANSILLSLYETNLDVSDLCYTSNKVENVGFVYSQSADVSLSNMIIECSYCSSSSLTREGTDFAYGLGGGDANVWSVENILFLNVMNHNSASRLFEIYEIEKFVLKNVHVKNTVEFVSNSEFDWLGESSYGGVQLLYLESVFESVRVEDLFVSGYQTYNLMYMRSMSSEVSVYLNNITVEDVHGNFLFTFEGNEAHSVFLNKIDLFGNDQTISDAILYVTACSGDLLFKDSVISNFIFGSSAKGVFLNYLYENGEHTVHFDNVVFKNLISKTDYFLDDSDDILFPYNSDNSGGPFGTFFDTTVGDDDDTFYYPYDELQLSEHGLIYIAGAYEVVIENCVFENLVNFVALIHCASYSACSVTVIDSLFNQFGKNDSTTSTQTDTENENDVDVSCYDDLDASPSMNTILLDESAYATLTLINNVFVGTGSTLSLEYDETSEVIFINNTVQNLTETSTSDEKSSHLCEETTVFLAPANTQSSGTAGACGNDADEDACISWADAMGMFGSGDILSILAGDYNITSTPFKLPYKVNYIWKFKDYRIIGAGSDKVNLYNHLNPNTTLFSVYDPNYQHTYLNISEFSYFPRYGMYQMFLYAYQASDVAINDIIIDASESIYREDYTSSSTDGFDMQPNQGITIPILSDADYSDLISISYTNEVIVSNMIVYNLYSASVGSSMNYKFNYQTDQFIIRALEIASMRVENLFIGKKEDLDSLIITNDNYIIQFLRAFGVFNELKVQNIQISNYYTYQLFYLYDCSFSDFNNIIIDSVAGGTLFTISYNLDAEMSFSNISVDGNGLEISNNAALMSFLDNNGNILIQDSIFSNFIFGEYAVPFELKTVHKYWYYYRSDRIGFMPPYYHWNSNNVVHFINVTFEDLIASGADGLIYITDNFDVLIENCVFKNNLNFVALIHCSMYSNCNVTIKNSTFEDNVHGYYKGMQMVNGIILEQYAYGVVSVENSVFIDTEDYLNNNYNHNQSAAYTVWFDETDSKVSIEAVEVPGIVLPTDPTTSPTVAPSDGEKDVVTSGVVTYQTSISAELFGVSSVTTDLIESMLLEANTAVLDVSESSLSVQDLYISSTGKWMEYTLVVVVVSDDSNRRRLLSNVDVSDSGLTQYSDDLLEELKEVDDNYDDFFETAESVSVSVQVDTSLSPTTRPTTSPVEATFEPTIESISLTDAPTELSVTDSNEVVAQNGEETNKNKDNDDEVGLDDLDSGAILVLCLVAGFVVLIVLLLVCVIIMLIRANKKNETNKVSKQRSASDGSVAAYEQVQGMHAQGKEVEKSPKKRVKKGARGRGTEMQTLDGTDAGVGHVIGTHRVRKEESSSDEEI